MAGRRRRPTPGSAWSYLNGETLLTVARFPGPRIRPVGVYGQCPVSATQAQSGRCDARHGPGHRLRWTRFHRWLSWLTLRHFMFGVAMEWAWVFSAELRFFCWSRFPLSSSQLFPDGLVHGQRKVQGLQPHGRTPAFIAAHAQRRAWPGPSPLLLRTPE